MEFKVDLLEHSVNFESLFGEIIISVYNLEWEELKHQNQKELGRNLKTCFRKMDRLDLEDPLSKEG